MGLQNAQELQKEPYHSGWVRISQTFWLQEKKIHFRHEKCEAVNDEAQTSFNKKPRIAAEEFILLLFFKSKSLFLSTCIIIMKCVTNYLCQLYEKVI